MELDSVQELNRPTQLPGTFPITSSDPFRLNLARRTNKHQLMFVYGENWGDLNAYNTQPLSVGIPDNGTQSPTTLFVKVFADATLTVPLRQPKESIPGVKQTSSLDLRQFLAHPAQLSS